MNNNQKSYTIKKKIKQEGETVEVKIAVKFKKH